MILCIDGNNFLRLYQVVKRGITDAQKKSFVYQLSLYKKERAATISEIILVFDAGLFGHATREVHSGIVVMHAGQKSSADDWICKFVERNQGGDILLISNDRALTNIVCRLGAKSMGCEDFYALMRQALERVHESLDSNGVGRLIKYRHSGIDEEQGVDTELDALMEQASRKLVLKDEFGGTMKVNRFSPSKKPSKLEKKTDKTLKKL